MRSYLARLFLFALLAGLLPACGGGGGSGPPGGGSTLGALTVTLTGLPSGVAGSARLTGPAGYNQAVDTNQSFDKLTPGSYALTAAGVVANAISYVPAPLTQAVTVSPGATASASIAYTSAPLILGLVRVASGMAAPIFASAPAGDSRLFIVERAGRVRILKNGSLLATPFLDISAKVDTGGEGGLLSMAFHPQYASNGQVFLYYTDAAQHIVIERRSVSAANPDLADAASGLVILAIGHPTYSNHYGGLAAFGPDGYLYLGTGDGGGAGDPGDNAGNTGSLLGKLLRLDVSASSAAQPYAVPPSNPFAGQTGKRGEIWAYGLRNPWRFAFDPAAALLYIADVGQARREEVDIETLAGAGLNYGWNTMEGSLCYNAASCTQTGLTLPAYEYDHGAPDPSACSITGGYVYRGRALPELAGHYLYSDYCAGFLKSFMRSGAGAVGGHADWAIPDIGAVLSFGRDGDGELYLISGNGAVYKIVRK